MPQPKPCQHHIRHENAVTLPKSCHFVPLTLLKFMSEHDDMQDLNVRWLCPNCYTFEMKELRQNQQEETQRYDLEEEEEEEEEERATSDEPDIDDQDTEESISCQADSTTSCSSQKSCSSNGDLYELKCQQEKALVELKNIFAVVDPLPIHDQWVHLFLILNFI